MPNLDDGTDVSISLDNATDVYQTERSPAGNNTNESVSTVAATADLDTVEARLAALERAITDDDVQLPDLEDEATVRRHLGELESELEDLTERVAELEAATRAIRGYAGGIDAVNEDVERKANLALAKVEKIERAHADEGLRVERLDAIPEVDETDDSDPERSVGEPTGAEVSDGGSSDEPNTQPDDGDRARSLAERLRDAL